ncbi:hypothetical protein GGI35DRAFT_103473 [Trichoderma velutinum]
MYGEVSSTRSSFRRVLRPWFPQLPSSQVAYPVLGRYLVLGNCTSSCHLSILPQSTCTSYEASLNLSVQDPTQQVCLLYHAPVAFSASTQSPALPAPMRIQKRRRFSPFAAPTCPVARADWPGALSSVPYQVPARPNLPSVPVQEAGKSRYPVLSSCCPPPTLQTRPWVSASGRNLQPQCGLAPSREQGIASISSLSPPACLHVLPPFCRRVTRPCPSAPLLRLSLQRRRIWSSQGEKNTPCKHKSCHLRPLTTAVATLIFFLQFFFSAF